MESERLRNMIMVSGYPAPVRRGQTEPRRPPRRRATATALLARTVRADESALRRVLRALVGVGILVDTDGTFALTALGRLLRRDVPGSLHGLAAL